MRMPGVDIREVRQADATFVDEDEWIDQCVRRLAGGQGLEDGLPHHSDLRCILH
jgi:hypothetical protein